MSDGVEGGVVASVSRRAFAVAAGWTALAVAAFVAIPLTAGDDPTLHVPSTGAAQWWAGLVVLLAQGVALVGRSTRPTTVLLAVAVAVPVGAAVGMADAIGLTSVPVAVAVYSAACAVPPARMWPSAVAAGGLVAAGQACARLRLHDPAAASVGEAVLQALGVTVVPLAVALFVVARRDARQAREQQVRAAAGEREARLEAAVSHERMAMARELHDIAAHHLSGIAVMTAAIGTQIDSDPEGAKHAVAQVREQSRTLLRDLRGLVGLLRDERPPGAGTSTQQTLAGVTALVGDAAATGMPVELVVLRRTSENPLGEGIGPLAQLAAYRIVQESLANAARHAPGARTTVVVDDRPADAVMVTVSNAAVRTPVAAGTEPGGGFGLVGMRERADLTGARLAYGPTDDGGWRVALSLPRQTDSVDEPGHS